MPMTRGFMKLDRKSRRALRAYMLSRSLMMRLWSQEDTYDLKGLLKEMENRYRHRSLQALCSLIKRMGSSQTKLIIEEAITRWKRSGAWREDVRRKPNPELVAIEKRIQELRENPPTDYNGLTSVLGSLQNYVESMVSKVENGTTSGS